MLVSQPKQGNFYRVTHNEGKNICFIPRVHDYNETWQFIPNDSLVFFLEDPWSIVEIMDNESLRAFVLLGKQIVLIHFYKHSVENGNLIKIC